MVEMSERVVVAGGGLSGLGAAVNLDSRGFDVLLIDRSREHVFKPALPELIRGRVSEEDIKFDLDHYLKNTDVEYTKEEIHGFNPEDKIVESEIGEYSYDYLVVALGAERKSPSFSLKYADDFYSLESAREACEKVEEAGSAVVIGSGRHGIEVSSELHRKGLKTTIVDRSTRPLPEHNEKASRKMLNFLNREEISFMGGKEVIEITNYGIELEDGQEVDKDMVVWCGGLEAPDIVQESFETGDEGIKVNRGLSAVNFDDVYAVGHCADDEFDNSAGNTISQGVHVAKNISDGENLLEDFKPSKGIEIVSGGNSGFLLTNENLFGSRTFRLAKDLSLKFYFLNLKRRRLQRGLKFSVESPFSFFDVKGK